MTLNWKLILYVSAGFVLSVVLTRLALHKPFALDAAIAAAVSVTAGTFMSVLLSILRPKPPMH